MKTHARSISAYSLAIAERVLNASGARLGNLINFVLYGILDIIDMYRTEPIKDAKI